VLRQNFVPILRLPLAFDEISPLTASTLFVKLGGRGIRDIEARDGSFTILAGPNGDEPQTFAIYSWDGHDQIAASDRPGGAEAKLICDLGFFGGSKPEGLAFYDQQNGAKRFILLFDNEEAPEASLITVRPGGE